MSGKPFLDTNVLIYAIAGRGSEAAKAVRARALLAADTVCLSTQVLGEFYRAVTSARRAAPLQHTEAVAWVQMWKRHDVRPITVAHVDLALELAARFQIGYYDALVVAAARLAGCPILYSEDLSDGQDYGGVRVENPFRAVASGADGAG
jgi:predicted nucleic acid-binding protein